MRSNFLSEPTHTSSRLCPSSPLLTRKPLWLFLEAWKRARESVLHVSLFSAHYQGGLMRGQGWPIDMASNREQSVSLSDIACACIRNAWSPGEVIWDFRWRQSRWIQRLLRGAHQLCGASYQLLVSPEIFVLPEAPINCDKRLRWPKTGPCVRLRMLIIKASLFFVCEDIVRVGYSEEER